MNNSKIALDNQEVISDKSFDRKPMLHQKEGELVKIIEAIMRVATSEDWNILKEHIFDSLVDGLERRLNSEAAKAELNQPEIYRLNGQLAWARKFSDFKKLADVYRVELSNVKQQLNNNQGTEPLIAPDTNEND